MNTVERVKEICKDRKIPISKLEKDCGFANGYIGQLRKGTFPDDRLGRIAEVLGLSVDYLRTGKESEIPSIAFADDYVELIDLYSKMSKENQIAIMQIMRNLK